MSSQVFQRLGAFSLKCRVANLCQICNGAISYAIATAAGRPEALALQLAAATQVEFARALSARVLLFVSLDAKPARCSASQFDRGLKPKAGYR